MTEQVPVIALTGYLGAGKTTVLNHLLRQPDARLGVVVNDFGAINVDAGLVSGQVDQIGSIAGGCICCIDDTTELDTALELLTRPGFGLDAVVIEASGIAEPGMLAYLIRFSGAERVRPAGVVDVVDAVEYFDTVDPTADRSPPPARFEVATLVVINKCDLAPVDQVDRIEDRVRAANPDVNVVRTRHGALDPTLVYDVGAEQDGQLTIGSLLREDPAGDHHAHHHAESVSVSAEAPVDPGALMDLLEDRPPGAYRIKGVVTVDTGRALRGYVVHVVGRQVHVLRAPAGGPVGHLVAIGVGLDVDQAHARLSAALAPATRLDPTGLRRLHRRHRLSQ